MLAMHNTSISSSHVPQSHYAHNHQSRPSSRAGSQHSSSSINSRPKQRTTSKKASSQRTERDLVAAPESSQPMKQQQPGLLSLSQPIAVSSTGSSSKRKGKAASRENATAEGSRADAHGVTAALVEDKDTNKSASSKGSKRKSKKTIPPRLLDSHNDDLLGATASNVLSQSAPSAATPLASASASGRQSGTGGGAATGSGLTWQQELLNSSKPRNPETSSLRSVKKKNSVKRTSGTAPASNNQAKSAGAKELTWQQALFNQPRSSGPQFDFFADERDAATFGSGDERAGAGAPRRRRRADSVGASSGGRAGAKSSSSTAAARGAKQHAASAASDTLLVDDVFNNARSPARAARKGVSVSAGAAPRTPNSHNHRGALSATQTSHMPHVVAASSPRSSSAAAAAVAYAGPDFHNSPSPHSLPAPKFNSRLRNSALASEGLQRSSSASGGETEGSESEPGASVKDTRDVRRQESPSPEKSKSKQEPGLAPPSMSNAPSMAATTDRNATIESLLARMMAPPRSAGI